MMVHFYCTKSKKLWLIRGRLEGLFGKDLKDPALMNSGMQRECIRGLWLMDSDGPRPQAYQRVTTFRNLTCLPTSHRRSPTHMVQNRPLLFFKS